jgi:hypothetical protein
LLWVGGDGALLFACLLLLFVAVHTLAAKFGWVGTKKLGSDPRPRIPFAPSIAAALIGMMMLGGL